jgi:hypothetical protein
MHACWSDVSVLLACLPGVSVGVARTREDTCWHAKSLSLVCMATLSIHACTPVHIAFPDSRITQATHRNQPPLLQVVDVAILMLTLTKPGAKNLTDNWYLCTFCVFLS